MASNDQTRNQRNEQEWNAEEKLDRKPVHRPEGLMPMRPDLYLPWVSPDRFPDRFPGENIVETSLSIVYIHPILHHS